MFNRLKKHEVLASASLQKGLFISTFHSFPYILDHMECTCGDVLKTSPHHPYMLSLPCT